VAEIMGTAQEIIQSQVCFPFQQTLSERKIAKLKKSCTDSLLEFMGKSPRNW